MSRNKIVENWNNYLFLKTIQDWFNKMHAKNTSQKILAFLKNKGESRIPLAHNIPYDYKKDENETTKWVVDVPAAEVVIAKKEKKLETVKNKIIEIDNLFRHIYENNVSGKVSDDRFRNLSFITEILVLFLFQLSLKM